MLSIHESGMHFGPFNDDQVFQIETSVLYKNIGKGIRTVEFLLTTEPESLLFLEAKSSSPRSNSVTPERFNEFIQEITEKFIHSFNLYYSAILKRHESNNDIPDSFRRLDNGVVKIKFCLVIKGHPISWLSPIRDALLRQMASHITIWKSQIAVLNDQLAKDRYHLIA